MIKEHKKRQPLIKTIGQWPIVLAIAMTATTGASLYILSIRPRSQIAPVSLNKPAVTGIGALGRIEPQGEVIHLSAPNALQGARVTQLLVKRGDKIRAGQVVVILDSNPQRLAALKQAQAQVEVYQARLAQVRAGAKAGDIAAQKATIANLKAELRGDVTVQKATIARLEDELRNAQTENRRSEQLYREGAISASDSDTKRLRVDTVQEQLNEAKANLNRTVATNQKQQSEATAKLESIAEVRPTDVQAAQAEVDNAKAAVEQAQAELELTYIRAPTNGQILKIYTRPGEVVGTEGIADLGQTNQMYVVAEVYETDIRKVHLGQQATITSESFSGKLGGTVTEIGLRVSKQNVFSANPASDTDHKVVEVKIRINDPANSLIVAGLTNLQVQVLIRL